MSPHCAGVPAALTVAVLETLGFALQGFLGFALQGCPGNPGEGVPWEGVTWERGSKKSYTV